MADSEAQALALFARLERRCEIVDSRFEDRKIRWHRIGAGSPLVLLHGGNGSWLHWVRNIESLARQHELWLPDLPGCGESDELPPPANLERLVAALQAAVDSLIGADREIGLAAFSFGSVLASNLAATRGGVRRLALLGATGHGFARQPLALRNWRAMPPGPAQTEAHRHNLAHLMLHDTAAIDALALVIHRQTSEQTRLRSRPLSLTDATRRALDRLEVPVLLAWGEHDPTAPAAEVQQTFAQGQSQRRLVRFAGAGHWLQYERAAEINALLIDWFSP
ncbi:MAG TPA: alpha/beta fold hydrolase [Ramlibacter sp.]|nr:alpha/beta fold hydrolase [Ramlibacter sp.]